MSLNLLKDVSNIDTELKVYPNQGHEFTNVQFLESLNFFVKVKKQ